MTPKKPTILNIETIASTGVFTVEKMDLEFSNGAKRQYQRLKPSQNGAVLVVPMLDDDTVLMIYEYSGGTERYELALTKGKIDDGETPLEAANRELMEEIGYAAKRLTFIKTLTLAPNYQANNIHLILAQDLYPARALGDEPEPLEVVKRSMADLESLVYEEALTEARSIAALYMVRDVLGKQ